MGIIAALCIITSFIMILISFFIAQFRLQTYYSRVIYWDTCEEMNIFVFEAHYMTMLNRNGIGPIQWK